MLFSTPFFLFVFLPVFFALYWFLPARRWVLLAGSMVFYGWSEPLFLLVVAASAIFDWVLGWLIHWLEPGHGWRKWMVGTGVAANLGLLVYAKYTVFAVVNVNAAFAHYGWSTMAVPAIVLPLGVSFIVFEKITYLVDLYRKKAAPSSSLLDYLNYVFLFPKLLAGPIIKYHDIAGQLARPSHRYEDVRDGMLRFIRGLAKKVLIADVVAPMVDTAFSLHGAALDPFAAWLGVLGFTLQIYFDFSGYSDMAIGLGRVLGFRIMENFNQPYLATSFTDFWRRWHISLSTWIKEYLYIPLGGNRVSPARGYVNLCICFLLSGLWHGAAWNYLVWGCFHGVALVADRAFWLRAQQALPVAVNRVLTLFLVVITWVFFRCESFGHAVEFLGKLAGGSPASLTILLRNDLNAVAAAFVAGWCIVLAPLVKIPRVHFSAALGRAPAVFGALTLLFFCIGRLAVVSFHPFLYFRF